MFEPQTQTGSEHFPCKDSSIFPTETRYVAISTWSCQAKLKRKPAHLVPVAALAQSRLVLNFATYVQWGTRTLVFGHEHNIFKTVSCRKISL